MRQIVPYVVRRSPKVQPTMTLRNCHALLLLLSLGLVGCRPVPPTRPPVPQRPALQWGCLVMTAEGVKWVPPQAGATPRLIEKYPADSGIPEHALSPDGRRLALVTADQGLVAVNLADGSRVQVGKPFGEDRGQRWHMAWSPDGQTLAYIELRKLYVWSQATGSRLLPTAGEVADLAWSPDGQHLAIGQQEKDEKDRGLWLLPVAGGTAKLLAPSNHDIFAAAWPLFSPDGKWVAFWHAYEGGALCFVRSDGTGYCKDLDFGGKPQLWRPDSSALVYVSLKDEVTPRGLYECTPTGKPVELTSGEILDFDLAPTSEAVWLRPAERKGEQVKTVGVYERRLDGLSDVGWTRVLPGAYGEARIAPQDKQVALFLADDTGTGKLYCGPWFGELQVVTDGVTQLLGWAQGAEGH